MAGKTRKNKNLTSLIVLVVLVIVGLPVIFIAVNGNKNSADALAFAVQNRIICPVLTRPTLVCPSPAITTNVSNNSLSNWWSGWGRNKKSACFWQCPPMPSVTPRPLPSKLPVPSQSPKSSCIPMPACLKAKPPCLIAMPPDGFNWCPETSTAPIPTKIPGPIYCTDIYCPLNCVQETSPDWAGCPICQCDPVTQ